jgi:hypothetical protein
MSNMSYCRFENTAKDLEDCYDHLEDKLSESEEKAKQRLLELCLLIVQDYFNFEE